MSSNTEKLKEAEVLRQEATQLKMVAEAQDCRETAKELVNQAKCQEAEVQKEFIKGVAAQAGKIALTGVIAATTGVTVG